MRLAAFCLCEVHCYGDPIARGSAHSEELSVSRQQITGDTVQVSVVTHEGEGVVDEMLNHERVEIDRVPIGRPVDAIPPVRQEGETTILPVVEEIIVVKRRLILREEVRIKRRHVSERHQERSFGPAEAGGSDHPHGPPQRL
jgi:uncharacterized protein (TIGR02271 family)